MSKCISVRGLGKTFTLHLQDGLRLPILEDVSLDVEAGECVVLHGASGAGKSTLLRCLYANYLASSGSIHVRHDDELVDLVQADAQQILAVRQRTLGFVTQFLRVIPRVATLDLVAQPLVARGVALAQARAEAGELLTQLRLPTRLWSLPPATFSGGEQQRVNIARTLICAFPILLLDEPTASLDAANRDTVIALISAARERGAAVVGIFHDDQVRRALATRVFPLAALRTVAPTLP